MEPIEVIEVRAEVVTPDWPWPGEYIAVAKDGSASILHETLDSLLKEADGVLAPFVILHIPDPRIPRQKPKIVIDWEAVCRSTASTEPSLARFQRLVERHCRVEE